MSSLPLQPNKCLIFWDFPMRKVVKIVGIPMSSLGGVHVISGIAQCVVFELIFDPVFSDFCAKNMGWDYT